MTEKVSTLIIAAPSNWHEAWARHEQPVEAYMSSRFPGFQFLIDHSNPFQMMDRFGLIPLAGTVGDGDRCEMLEPLSAETMEEMYDALADYGAKPTVN